MLSFNVIAAPVRCQNCRIVFLVGCCWFYVFFELIILNPQISFRLFVFDNCDKIDIKAYSLLLGLTGKCASWFICFNLEPCGHVTQTSF